MNKPLPKNDNEAKIWRLGYEAGVQATLKNNELAIKIGGPIIEVIESYRENYDE